MAGIGGELMSALNLTREQAEEAPTAGWIYQGLDGFVGLAQSAGAGPFMLKFEGADHGRLRGSSRLTLAVKPVESLNAQAALPKSGMTSHLGLAVTTLDQQFDSSASRTLQSSTSTCHSPLLPAPSSLTGSSVPEQCY